MTRYLIFDLDGTLSDTHRLARATWLEVLRPYGIDVDFAFYKDRIHGRDREEVLGELVPSLDREQRRLLSQQEREKYDHRLKSTTPLPGLAPFMQGAIDAGFGLALVTNAPRYDAEISLTPLGLINTFDVSVFADDHDVEATKPAPSPYRAALDRLNIPADQAIAFEDSTTGIRAAHKANIPAIGLVTTHCPDELRRAGAARVVGDYADSLLDDVLRDPTVLND